MKLIVVGGAILSRIVDEPPIGAREISVTMTLDREAAEPFFKALDARLEPTKMRFDVTMIANRPRLRIVCRPRGQRAKTHFEIVHAKTTMRNLFGEIGYDRPSQSDRTSARVSFRIEPDRRGGDRGALAVDRLRRAPAGPRRSRRDERPHR